MEPGKQTKQCCELGSRRKCVFQCEFSMSAFGSSMIHLLVFVIGIWVTTLKTDHDGGIFLRKQDIFCVTFNFLLYCFQSFFSKEEKESRLFKNNSANVQMKH